jgi:hypothetical protein
VTANVGDKTPVRLPGGADLLLEEIALHRNVTYTFFDQAMQSIPAIEPKSRILVTRRDGQVGREAVVVYSLVAYPSQVHRRSRSPALLKPIAVHGASISRCRNRS